MGVGAVGGLLDALLETSAVQPHVLQFNRRG